MKSFFDIKLSDEVYNMIRMLLLKEDSTLKNTIKLENVGFDDLFISVKNVKILNNILIVEILDILENYEKDSGFKLLDNISKQIWDYYFPNSQGIKEPDNEFIDNFITKQFESKICREIQEEYKNIIIDISADKVMPNKIQDDISYKYHKELPKKYNEVLENIYVAKKLYYFISLINKESIYEKVSLMEELKSDILSFKLEYLPKQTYKDIIGNKFSKNTKNKLNDFMERTNTEICNIHSDNFTTNEPIQSIFHGLYTKNTKNNLYEYTIKSKADIYKKDTKSFFILLDIYSTYLKMNNLFTTIESFNNILKDFLLHKKNIPSFLCDDSLLELYEFQYIIPTKARNHFFVMLYAYLLKSDYEDCRNLISLLLSKRNGTFAKYDHRLKYKDIEISLQNFINILDKINN